MWLYLHKDQVKGEMKKLKPLKCKQFNMVEQVNKNAFRLTLPPCMQISLVVNVEYLKLFEPSMMDEKEDHRVLHVVEDFTAHALQ